MSTSTSNRRKTIQARARRRQRQNKLKSIALAAAGVILIAFVWYWSTGERPATQIPTADIDYNSEDVVYDQPLLAIHEMTGPSLASIPFLPEDGPQPQIAVSEMFYDFGSIGSTAVVQHVFVITNLGEAPLTISRAYTTCGCTTAEFTSTVIPPGKVVTMTLILDAGFHDVRGETVRRGVIIENNDPENSELEIWTQASVQNSP